MIEETKDVDKRDTKYREEDSWDSEMILYGAQRQAHIR